MFRRENGNMFHIAMLALKHLIYETSGLPQHRVVDIEHPIKPEIYLSKSGGPIRKYRHDADIMLAEVYKKGGQGKVIELKSWKEKFLDKGTVLWTMGVNSNSHKQFYLDHVARKDSEINDFEWLFQDFTKKDKTRSGPKQTDIEGIVWRKMARLPKPLEAAKKTLGKARSSDVAGRAAVRKIGLANIKTLVKNEASTFLRGIASETIIELVDNLN